MRFQSRGGCHVILQLRLCIVYIVVPDLITSLPQEQGVITCIKLRPALKSCNQVPWNNTGGRPVLWGGQSRVGDLQSCLLCWKESDNSRKRDRKKEFCKASSTGHNAFLMSRLMRWTKPHSFLKEFFRPAYSICRCWRATPDSTLTESLHPSPYRPAIPSPTVGHWWNRQCGGFRWPCTLPYSWNTPPPSGNSAVKRSICSCSAVGSSPTEVPAPSCPTYTLG